jgi:epoxyqueuosine reductase
MTAEPHADTDPDAETLHALAEELRVFALQQGFARVGIARAERLEPEASVLQAWLGAGHHGQMAYMQETAEVRADPSHPGMLSSARSAIVVVAALPGSASAPAGPLLSPGRVARYAHGRDYHNVMRRKLRGLSRKLRACGHAARDVVDRMPVLERALAQRAGVGFVGKNCCVIVPGLGSHVMLGVVLTSAELPADQPMRERCGECRACLDACPTRAFVAERTLDARRCASYLTIEHEGSIDVALRPQLGDWLFGCDVCQDVCPWNQGATRAVELSALSRERPWHALSAEALLRLDEAGFLAATEGSPLRRAGRDGLARNAALVLGNRGGRVHLPVLLETAAAHTSSVVREAASWAAQRIEARVAGSSATDGDATLPHARGSDV